MSQIFADVEAFLSAYPALTIAIAFLVAFGEAMLILGLFVPSTVVLVAAGTLVGLGKIALFPVFAATVIGAVAGDALSFWIGRRWKDRLRQAWPFSRYSDLLARGERFFARYGEASIFVVRFIPGVKAVVPTIAGMAGMSQTRFTIVNVASAIVWSAVHLLPAVLIGRGIKVANAGDPRLLVIGVLALVLGIAVWLLTRFGYAMLRPLADRILLRLMTKLARSRRPGAKRLLRLMRDRDGLLPLYALSALALMALAGFFVVLDSLLFDPTLQRSDAAISAALDALHTNLVTRAMVAVTMLGDVSVMLPAAVLLILLCLAYRQWSVAGTVVLSSLTAVLFVETLKVAMHRERPIPLYSGSDAFSFPSGHAVHSAVILGTFALFAARTLPQRFHRLLYVTTALVVATIGFSRVYLAAHWPSDVLGGLSFGAALLLVLAVFLHTRPIRVPGRAFAALAAVVFLGLYPAHLVMGYRTALAAYAQVRPVAQLDAAAWIAGGWRSLPPGRVLLDGDFGEPVLLQADVPQPRLMAALTAAGWAAQPRDTLGSVIGALVPGRGDLMAHPVWPMTHDGHPPLAVLVRPTPGQAGSRDVLRLWDAGVALTGGAAPGPRLLVLASASRDGLSPLAFGFTSLEQAELDEAGIAALRAGLSAALEAPDLTRIDPAGGPVIVQAAAP